MKRSSIAFATLLATTALLSQATLAAEKTAEKMSVKPDSTQAADAQVNTIKFSFANEEITKMIEAYSLATGQRFVIDPGVRGRATILAADHVSQDEAFNLLSNALAINSFAIRNEGDTMIVQPARTVSRSQMEVTTTLPVAKPERMVTYIVPLKYVTASYVNRTGRFLPSKDGELSSNDKNNSVTIIDWSSNIQRIDRILKELDKPVDPKIAKMVDAEHKQWLKERPQQQPPEPGPRHEHAHDGPPNAGPGEKMPPKPPGAGTTVQ